MGKFKFEDNRQAWETGPHWELKREFMEKYCDTFSEDRLLCLAQAYANVVLMDCSYPAPVMRQINELSKPLQMRKMFQQSSDYSQSESSDNPQNKVSGKAKAIYEKAGKSFKEIKFCRSEEVKEQSNSLDLNPVDTEASMSIECMQICKPNLQEHNTSLFSLKNMDKIKSNGENSTQDAEIHQKSLHIISKLGLEFIQNLVQQARIFQAKFKTPLESLTCGTQALKTGNILSFIFKPEPNSPKHAQVFCCDLIISDCVIATGKGTSKQKAKFVAAETALDILIDLSSQTSSKAKIVKTDISKSSVKRTINDIDCTSSERQDEIIKRQKSSDLDSKEVEMQNLNQKSDEQMKLLQHFSKNLCEWRKNQPPYAIIHNVAKSLNMLGYISYTSTDSDSQSKVPECAYKFLFNHQLISIGKGIDIKHAKWNAAELGFTKLINLSEYEIQDGELKECKNNSVEPPINSTTNNESFILNQKLFNNSLQSGFVLIDNLSNFTASHRNVKAVLSDSASYCRKKFGYDVEDIHGNGPTKYRVNVLIDGKVVGTGESCTKDDGKVLACTNAIEMLRKENYIVKIKNEYIDGFVISRDQVAAGESFKTAPLSESNKGCLMLKSMGWTGGGLKPTSISEPVEVKDVSFGRGLGWGNEGKGNNNANEKGRNIADFWLFKKQISSMLQEYSKSNSMNDLIFAKDFLKNERKEIHQIAGRYNLHTVSRGQNENRFLSVRRKYTVPEILNHLAKIGGSNSKFELVDSSNTPFKISETTSV